MTHWPPRWQDPEDYRYTAELSPTGWAWEFVRRNPEYREFWDAEVRRLLEAIRKGDSDYYGSRVGFRPGTKEPAHTDPNAPRFWIYSKQCQEQWGFGPPTNPYIEGASPAAFSGASVGAFIPGISGDLKVLRTVLRWAEEEDWELQHLRASIVDLRQPIAPQLERIRAYLLLTQKELKEQGEIKVQRTTRHDKKWPMYLRLLDARAAGATPQEIAEHFYPNPKADEDPIGKIAEKLKQATAQTKPEVYLKALGLPIQTG